MHDELEVTQDEFFKLVMDWMEKKEMSPYSALTLLGACLCGIAVGTECRIDLFKRYLKKLEEAFKEHKEKSDANKSKTE